MSTFISKTSSRVHSKVYDMAHQSNKSNKILNTHKINLYDLSSNRPPHTYVVGTNEGTNFVHYLQ